MEPWGRRIGLDGDAWLGGLRRLSELHSSFCSWSPGTKLWDLFLAWPSRSPGDTQLHLTLVPPWTRCSAGHATGGCPSVTAAAIVRRTVGSDPMIGR